MPFSVFSPKSSDTVTDMSIDKGNKMIVVKIILI